MPWLEMRLVSDCQAHVTAATAPGTPAGLPKLIDLLQGDPVRNCAVDIQDTIAPVQSLVTPTVPQSLNAKAEERQW